MIANVLSSIATNLASGATDKLLTNDSDPDNNPLVAVKVAEPTRGAVTMNADGTFTYVKGLTFKAFDRFTYKANDGSADSNVATATVFSHEASIVRKFYLQVLGREPDDGGLEYWAQRVEHGDP